MFSAARSAAICHGSIGSDDLGLRGVGFVSVFVGCIEMIMEEMGVV